ncbi:MAG TPA: hypothetical protein VHU92_23030 [Streptosporangiaceae bacterium]|nr:hypothetical protein [Streptosporangiaceae bacterium]
MVGRRSISLVGLIYLIIGVAVAWDRDYITGRLLKGVVSALAAVFLWWLPLLGVNLHLR